MVVKVGYGGKRGSNQIRGVGFVVAAFSTDSIEQFTAEGQVRHEIYYVGRYISNLRTIATIDVQTYGCS